MKRNTSFYAAALILAIGSFYCCGGKAGETETATPDFNSVTTPREAADTSETGEPRGESEAGDEKTAVKGASTSGVERLKAAYPQKIKDIRDNTIFFTDGTTMVYDDGKKKDFVTMLDYSDPEDMFLEAYEDMSNPPAYLHDVGRSRSEELFKKLYGNSKAAVEKQLTYVDWFGGRVRFSSSNDAAKQLEKVQKELAQHPELKKYLKNSGTFYWRKVRGANRLSAHSYGIAIDIGEGYNDYWLWSNKGAGELKKISYKNRMPMEIVEIFEKYGFIWGGRWYHYDTMHFEYRPELNPPKK